MRVALVSLCALVLAGAGFAGTPKATPGGTLKAEIAAFNAKNWVAAYAGYSKQYRASCPFAKFKAGQLKQRAQIPAGLTLGIKITGVKIAGSTAYLSYHVLLAGQSVATVKAPHADKFVEVGSLWYDDVDSQTTC